MKNKIYGYLSVFSYLISSFILIFCIGLKLIPNFNMSTLFKILLLLIVCILIYISGFILIKKLNYTPKILKVNLIIYFLIYIITIFSLTLFDEIYGRQGLIIIDWDKSLLDYYIKYSFNIVPFDTIKLFINGYIKGIVTFKDFAINIIGNFTAFMPFGIFLPLMFKNMRKYCKFLLVMIIVVIMIEVLQFVTMSGSCDIDDLILNVFGASVIYYVFKIKCVNRFIKKIFLFE